MSSPTTTTACPTCGRPLAAGTGMPFCLACLLKPANDWVEAVEDTPAWGEAPEWVAGDRIGSYRLEEKIGEGGFGLVFRALQLHPIRREVAMKLLKPGMASRQIIRRFEGERQALAQMDHPNVARVYDAGTTDVGGPYFVMELARGLAITDHCRAEQLLLPDRLRLFLQACRGVQHAHQKGIIHRDIKPSNVLVVGEAPYSVAKVIDFGVAKALEQSLEEQTLYTAYGQIVGTPQYMSPEQAASAGVDVDTRTDVYSLGVLLYELLTGSTPLDPTRVDRGSLEETLRAIREEEPRRPSAVIEGNSKPGATVVSSQLRGDLDLIVMKALAKDRARRYVSPLELAQDVERFMAGEPIEARAPSAAYLIATFARRNRLVLRSAAVIVAILLTAAVVNGLLAVRASNAETKAQAALVTAEENRRAAVETAAESQRRLVRLHVTTASRLAEEGDLYAAMLWTVEAMKLDAEPRTRLDVHRRRFAALRRAAPSLRQILLHDTDCAQTCFSPDGARVLTNANGEFAQLWDAGTGQPLGPPVPGEGGIQFIGFSPAGRAVVGSDTLQIEQEDGRFRCVMALSPGIWNIAQSRDGARLIVRTPTGLSVLDSEDGSLIAGPLSGSETAGGFSLQANGERAVAVVGGNAVRLWGLPSGQPLRADVPVPEGCGVVSLSPDARWLVAVGPRPANPVHTFDLAADALPQRSWRPGGDMFDIDVSPKDHLATASWDGSARIFDLASGLPVCDAMRHLRGVSGCMFDNEGNRLLTTSWDNTCRVWNAATGEPLTPPLPHGAYVQDSRFSPDGTQVASCGRDQVTRLWSLDQSGSHPASFRDEGDPKALSVSPGGRYLVTGSTEGCVTLRDGATRRELARISHGAAVRHTGWLRGEERFYTAGADGCVRLWSVSQPGTALREFKLTERITAVATDPGGQFIAASAADGAVRVWQVATGEPLTPLLAHPARVDAVDISADGRRLATGCADTFARVWEIATGQLALPPLRQATRVSAVRFHADGTRLLTAVQDAEQSTLSALQWDLGTGTIHGLPLKHADGIFDAAYSPDQRLIVTVSEDTTARVWEADTGRPAAPPMRHGSYVMGASFSPDGRLLLTWSSDHTARVWDTRDGEPVTPPLQHDSDVIRAAWFPDGSHVVTESVTSVVRVWDVSPAEEPPAELQRQAEMLAARRLDPVAGGVWLTKEEIRARWEAAPGKK